MTYTKDVNHFYGDYDPLGSGKISKIADNKDYRVEDLLKAVAQQSDNVATNILGYYLCHQYDKAFCSEIKALSGIDWDMEQRLLTSRSAANMMEAIYHQKAKLFLTFQIPNLINNVSQKILLFQLHIKLVMLMIINMTLLLFTVILHLFCLFLQINQPMKILRLLQMTFMVF